MLISVNFITRGNAHKIKRFLPLRISNPMNIKVLELNIFEKNQIWTDITQKGIGFDLLWHYMCITKQKNRNRKICY